MRDIAVRFVRPDRSVTHAANGVSLTVFPGETLGIVGESSSGKTTIGKVALALRKPDAGDVLFRGHAWSQLLERERRPLRRHIQTIVQDPLNSFDPRYAVAAFAPAHPLSAKPSGRRVCRSWSGSSICHRISSTEGRSPCRAAKDSAPGSPRCSPASPIS
ncbi:ATP-binding cassette domain-containing protein [Bosea sp. RCC_152_1]